MKHYIHVEQGPEYIGETYMWCDCIANGVSHNQIYTPSYDQNSAALFQGGNLTELLEWIKEHTNEPRHAMLCRR